MFLERLFNQGSAPVLERMAHFTAQRHKLLAENVANADTPGYRMKDVSLTEFQQQLIDRVEERKTAKPGTVGFDDITADVRNPRANILFHDRNNRSMDQLMSDAARNGLMHNMYTELIRRQYGSIDSALKERVT